MKIRTILPLILAALVAAGGFTGGLSATAAGAMRDPCTHLVFVIDTSVAMRDAKSGRLAPAIFQTVTGVLAAHPEVRALQLIDADGRRMLGDRDDWVACGFDAVLGIERVLNRYTPSTEANPVPGIVHALRQLPDPTEAGTKVQVCVIGEALVSPAESALCRLDDLNPADANGRRRAVISAVQLATARGARAKAGGEDANFRNLMTEVARLHGGTFRRVADTRW